MSTYDLAVVGGGPAGTSAAITAARQGARVLLLERSRLPRHKVCGEFVSAESLHLLSSLLAGTEGANLVAEAPRMTTARIFLGDKILQSALPAPAASVARHDLDLALWHAAEAAGADARLHTAVERVVQENGEWRLATTAGNFAARAVVDATGRWSNLRQAKAPGSFAIGIKAHFQSAVAEPGTVDLYFIDGGYCGVTRVNRDEVNVCAMAPSDALGISRERALERILHGHPDLRRRSAKWQLTTEVFTTSPLVFRRVIPAEDGIVRAGDAAGFIDPFAGDGISLALRSGALAAESLRAVWQEGADSQMAARDYAAAYGRQFARLFRRTAMLRRALATPMLWHAVRAGIVRGGMLDFVIRATRAV